MGKPTARSSSPTTSRRPSRTRPRAAGDLFQGETTRAAVERLSQQAAERKLPELAPEDAKAISGVFARMKSIYGHLWSSNFRNADQLALAQIDWLRAIRGTGAGLADVNRALDWCAGHEADMPNLPRFLGILRAVKARTQAEAETRRALEHAALPESDEHRAAREAREAAERAERQAAAREEIGKIKAMLG